jgi:hypothetical protein
VVCRACNRACVPIDLWQADRNRLNKSFFTVAPSAFTYPVKGFGLMVVGLLTVFFTLLRFFILVPTQGIPVAIIGFGYLVTVMRQVINSTAAGEDAFREWPDFAHLWDDLVLPFFQFLGVFLLCLGPGFLCMAWNPVLGLLLLLLGAICLPMAILMVAMADALSALNPLLLFASIAKVPKEYVLTCALFVVTLAGNAWFQRVMADSAWRGFNPVLHLFTAYALMIEARLLGLLYRTCEKRLGWFA